MYLTYLLTTQQQIPQPCTQITFEQLLAGINPQVPVQLPRATRNYNPRTISLSEINLTTQYLTQVNQHINEFVNETQEIWETYAEQDMTRHYQHFEIPKASGGTRPIDAPTDQLKADLRKLNDALKNAGVHAHTAAYAYVPTRCHKDAIERHQRTGHTHYLHVDLHNFFGSCTIEFMEAQLRQIPFFMFLGHTNLMKILHMASLRGALPQGSPLSPWLTNQIMLPIDFELTKYCEEHAITYTRYADDMIFSANFNPKRSVLTQLNELLCNTPLRINEEKTKSTTINGRNWNLGLMVNQDNKLSVGYKKKELMRARLTAFCNNHDTWTCKDAQEFLGVYQYNAGIEPEYFQALLTKYNNKYNMDILATLKTIIKTR